MSRTNFWVKTVTLSPPSLNDNTGDAERLLAGLRKSLPSEIGNPDLEMLRDLPDLLRKWNYQVRCILLNDLRQWKLIGITSIHDESPVAGLAVDIGTSRVVIRLIDLATGDHLAESAFDNPQIAIGPDVLTRIHYAGTLEGRAELNGLIIEELNRQIVSLTRSCHLTPQNVYMLSVAGNTAMTHLFMGLNPHWLIREPYIPVVNKPGFFKASELGIQANPLSRVFIFPNVGSYFGGDLIAGILYSKLNESDDPVILVDVGTNAEVVLGDRNWLIACAGAAGPALEGGVTRMGMMAGAGVIDRISVDAKTQEFIIHTINDEAPRGICGSGLIDLAANLFLTGKMDIRGKLVPSACGDRIKIIDEIPHLIIVPAESSATREALTISQPDLDSLVRSKAAMYTILETITLTVGMTLNDLSTFYVAGTFGMFINPKSAITIGMLPDLPLDKYIPIGNSSLEGATLALTSPDKLDEINGIRDRITYLELNVNQEFMNRFSAAKFIPHTDRSRFPSVTLQS